ncbi:MAG TPA: glycine zipper 2TM domain-containing protein [Steroidobacteraceae bacterium]|nr:glycine zipper 2TM domain-containing protein [Steroidobacteraceae bacterium]
MSIPKKQLLVGVLAAACTMSAALAQDYDQRYDPRYDDYDRGGVYDYAKVVDVQPLTTRVRVSTPQRECWDETRYDDGGYSAGGHGQRVAGSTLLGAVIGAAIGNQIGHGDGRRAATAGGAIVGAAIGHQQGMRRYGANTPPQAYSVQRCETRYHDEYQERIDGYRVTYLYHGRRQVTELPYRPGDRIRVRVDVTPAQ